MTYDVETIADYIQAIPKERQPVFQKLRQCITENLPEGFDEQLQYKMIGYVVPHDIYPDGYHCDAKVPLPFINLGSQKNYIALYHTGIYAMPALSAWWKEAYPKHATTKLDMGKSCIRFKKLNDIPYDLIGELCTKVTVEEWINIYEKSMKKG